MITYVNTVLVNNKAYSNAGDTLWVPSNGHANPTTSDAGKFVIMTMDEKGGKVIDSTVVTPYLDAALAADAETMRVGIITSDTNTIHKSNGYTETVPVIKWSAVINKNAIKSYTRTAAGTNSEDTVYIDFSQINVSTLKFNEGDKRIIVRLTFKDLPTRFRKWTESYEYVTVAGDTKATIALKIAQLINKEWKRARVSAVVGAINTTEASNDGIIPGSTTKYFHKDSNWGTASATTGEVIQLVAMPYDDDNSAETINWENQVRFNANAYYTDPEADGWASKNKYFITGTVITKVPGKYAVGYGKMVRDHEAQAMGYDGILNRGDGTWPIIKPAVTADITAQYNAITVEFENMYHSADDLVRKTKQTVEIYSKNDTEIKAVIDAFAKSVNEKLAGKLDVPAASGITDGHLAVWDKTDGVVSLEDGGAKG